MSKYGSIDDEILAKKYELTDMVYNDLNTIDDFNRNILRDTGPDKATMASDAKRSNVYSETRINLREKGSRWKNEPIHHDLNLSLTDKDPRGTAEGPDWKQFNVHTWARKNDHIFINDADHSVPSAGVSQSQVRDNKLKARIRVAKDCYKDFSSSQRGMIVGYNQNTSVGSTLKKIETTSKLQSLNDEYNIEKRRDITTILSNILPIGHLTTTDNRFNVANFSKLYSTNNIDTMDYIKNSFKSGKSGKDVGEAKENQLAKQLNIMLVDVIQNKEKMMNKDQEINYGEENMISNKNHNNSKEYYSSKDLRSGEQTEKTKQLTEEIIKNYTKQVDKYKKHKDFNKTDMTLPETSQKGAELITQISKLASQNRNLKSAMVNIVETHNKKKMSLGNDLNSVMYKRNHNILNKSRADEDSIVDFNSIQRQNVDSKNTKQYKTNLQHSKQNKTVEYKKDFDPYALTNENTDIYSQQRKTNLNQPDISSQDDVLLETQFGENKYLNRSTGKMGTKYLFNQHTSDQDNDDINEKTSMKTRMPSTTRHNVNTSMYYNTTQQQKLE